MNRHLKTYLLALCTLAGAVSAIVLPSTAEATFPPKGNLLCSIPSTTTLGVAFDEKGRLFAAVGDQGFTVYDRCGNFLFNRGVPTPNESTGDIAVNNKGQIIITDAINGAGDKNISVFTRSGRPLFNFVGITGTDVPLLYGVAVDKKGQIYVSGTTDTETDPRTVRVFDSCGNFLYEFGSGTIPKNPTGIALNSDGQIIISDFGTTSSSIVPASILVFDPKGKLLFKIGDIEEPRGVAVNESGQILVLSTKTGNEKVVVYDRCGNFLKDFRVGSNPQAIAVSNDGLVAVSYFAPTNRIDVFD